MADSTSTPGEQSNQPAAAAAGATPVAAAAGSPPPSVKPDPAAAAVAAKPSTEGAPAADAAKAAADAAAAEAAKAGDPAKAAADAAAAAAAAKAAAPVIPETYEIKLPEDLAKAGVQLDKNLIESMTPVFKDLGLTAEAAQKLATAAIAYQQGLPKAMLARDLEVTLKDPEIGGLNWARTQANVKLALGAFTTVQERAWLERAGIGNRLEFVRVFDRIGKAMAAAGDVAERGGPDGAPELSRADRMYGGANKQS